VTQYHFIFRGAADLSEFSGKPGDVRGAVELKLNRLG
jgi:hypothetical protein